MSAPRESSTRREFLQGKSALDALASVGQTAAEPPSLAAREPEAYLLRLARRAMACEFEMYLNAGQYPRDSENAMAALDLVDRIEDQLTVYRENSEVSFLNRHAAREWVEVEPRLFDLLQTAVELHRRTGGAYDITTGPLSRVWGFTRRAGAVPTPEDLAEARQAVGTQWMALDPDRSAVRFLRDGVSINLGSIGKGYALDRCAELFAADGIHDFLLHGGNSSVLGRGTQAGQAPGREGWSVGVRNPLRPDRRLGTLRLRDRALATSGSGTQFFVHEGQRYGHILDPRTGWPAQGVLSVTVLAPTAAWADALSTAFYVLGPEAAEQYCQNDPEIAALMLCPGPRAGSLATYLFGIDPADWTTSDQPSPR